MSIPLHRPSTVFLFAPQLYPARWCLSGFISLLHKCLDVTATEYMRVFSSCQQPTHKNKADSRVSSMRACQKVCFYSAISSPLDRSKRFTLFALPDRPVHSDTNSASPGSILARQQLRATTKSLTCPPLSIARYSFIQLSERKGNIFSIWCELYQLIVPVLQTPHTCTDYHYKMIEPSTHVVTHVRIGADQEHVLNDRQVAALRRPYEGRPSPVVLQHRNVHWSGQQPTTQHNRKFVVCAGKSHRQKF